jgi:lipopolysaccharide/colanic/teichoic acid biosynthesis glycosyltransferase
MIVVVLLLLLLFPVVLLFPLMLLVLLAVASVFVFLVIGDDPQSFSCFYFRSISLAVKNSRWSKVIFFLYIFGVIILPSLTLNEFQSQRLG